MNGFLERIQLIQRKQIKLAIDKSEFIRSFKQHVDEGSIGGFFTAFEVFSSSKNRYKGTITQHTFAMRRRRQFFDRHTYSTRVTGTFRQQNDQVVIDAKVNGFSNFMIPFYIIITVFYLFFIFMFSTGINQSGIPILFILFHAVLMYGIPYFMIRKRVKSTVIDLEKELFYMMKKGQ